MVFAMVVKSPYLDCRYYGVGFFHMKKLWQHKKLSSLAKGIPLQIILGNPCLTNLTILTP